MMTNTFWAAIVAVTFALPASAKQPADAWITTKTKIALLADTDVDGTRINVDTSEGVVTLYGAVPDRAQHQRAIDVAKGIEGVTSVRDLMTIQAPSPSSPAKPKPGTESTDATLRKRVETALNTPRLEGSDIKVASVENGVVTLSGDADSLSDQRVALARARSVPGVKRVTDKITAADPDDIASWRERTVKEGKVASRAGDAWITSAAKLRLLADESTPGLAINVDTDDGVVTLFGIVPTAEAKAKAEAEVSKVDDVVKVVNALQVVPEEKQARVERKDDEILTAVRSTLDDDARLDGDDIDVEVKNGVVRLTGTVASPSDRVLAAQRARAVAGVRAVRQELQVKVAAEPRAAAKD